MDYIAELKHTLGDINIVSADDGGHFLLSSAKSFILDKKQELQRMHAAGAGGAAIVASYTALADALITCLFEKFLEDGSPGGHALLALGGYGRKELCFCSDLDIMLFHAGQLQLDMEALNSFLISFLWDIGFTVGHSVRSFDEALSLGRKDDVVLTSILESRLLVGDRPAFESLKDALFVQLRTSGTRKFMRLKEMERKRDYREAGDEVYNREPDVKFTAGGLRDYHTGMWIALAQFGLGTLRDCHAEGLLPEEQFLRVERALDFLWRVRNQMHLECGTLHDVLTLRFQEHLATVFGYPSSQGALPVELFMQDYYSHAYELHRFYREMLRLGGLSRTKKNGAAAPRGGKTERGLRIARRTVFLPRGDENWFREDPARLVEIIWYCQRHGYMLGEQAEASIRKNLALIDDTFRISPVVRDHFMALLSDLSRVGTTLRQMSDLGILDRYLPEFGSVRNLIRFDSFHQYPVHEHTLRALENLAMIPYLRELGTDALKAILPEIREPALLALSVLLHDLGKASDGSHVENGIRIAQEIASRLQLDPQQTQTLLFLIRNHLRMTHLSQYRDLEDDEIIRSFASEIGSLENLNMLYLLTFADLYAVRQGSWNDWKSALLYDLHNKTRAALERSTSPQPKTQTYWQSAKAKAVTEWLPRNDSSVAEDHLKHLSERYLLTFPPKEIAEHIRMVASLERRTSTLKCVPLSAYSLSHVTICTKDRLGLFADIVGTFASQQVSVLHAAIFTRADGIAIDSFYVVDAKSEGPLASTKWAIVKEHLRKVLRGERDVRQLLQNAVRNPRALHRTMVSLPCEVHFDNKVSASHTVVDIEAPDRVGLLYDIASTFSNLQMNLFVAKVTTDVRHARDAFYVTDASNEKILDPLRLQEIKEKLEDVLKQTSPATVSHNVLTKSKRRVKSR